MCSTGAPIRIAAWEPPAINQTKIIFDIANVVTRICCDKEAKLTIQRLASNPRQLEEHFHYEDEAMVLPVMRTQNKLCAPPNPYYQYIEVLESPGLAVLLRAGYAGSTDVGALMQTLFGVLIIILLSCILAGVLVWALDTRVNPEEFPGPFFKGVGEGTWWAFVSMTTVGYGDKTPKSILGRILGCTWILSGTAIIAIFTAAMTTVFNQDAFTIEKLFGLPVAVINGTDDYNVVTGLGSRLKAYPDFFSVLDAVSKGVVNVAVVDLIYVLSHSHHVETKDVRFATHLKNPTSHGFLLSKLKMTEENIGCYIKETEKRRFLAHQYFSLHNELSGIRNGVDGSDQLNRILSINVPWMLGLSLIVIVVFITLMFIERLLRPDDSDDGVNCQLLCQPRSCCPEDHNEEEDVALTAKELKQDNGPSYHSIDSH